jgi:outer membrane protein OmpA-like peptidoglycan-associated protein
LDAEQAGVIMRKFLVFSMLWGVSACAYLPGGPPVPTTPATPVFFQPFSAALDPAALSTIASAAQAANEEPGVRVTVIGAADNTGTPAANRYLSETRAQVVADTLVADGVDRSRIRVRGIGETGAPNDMAQSSRRALISIGG